MTKKSIDDYSADILQLTVELSTLPDYHPAVEKLNRQLSNRLRSWQSKLDIIIRVASNEQLPWQDNELGYVTVPMDLKKSTGRPQIGDYTFEILNDDQSITMGNLVVERKGGKTGPEDMYSTFMNRDGRERFYREVMRYEADKRFSQMIIIAECTLQDFLTYAPKFNGNNYNKYHIGASIESRRATIAGLFARGVPVLFADSRQEAQKTYLQLIRQSCIKNYKQILNIEV